MQIAQAELIADVRNATGESPWWDAKEQALYWTDIPSGVLHRWRADSDRISTWQAPEMLACFAAHAKGGWVAGLETGVFRLTVQTDGRFESHLLASVDHLQSGMRFNDGRCDRQGRFLAGTMVMDMGLSAASGCIYSYSSDSNSLRQLLDGFVTPNGMAFSPDGQTMYLSDSHPSVQMIWAFDYDTTSGTPTRRRLFVDMKSLPGRPDGAAMDVDGCYWICGNDAGLVHRFTPAGKLDMSLSVPVKKPSMCAFGGPNLDTLFVTSIRPSRIDLTDQPLAGGVFALRPGVQGLAEPVFNFST
jgi:sugar lactone lactonase YvrE